MGWSYTKPPGWTTTTKRILARDQRRCYVPGCITPATQVDHLVSVKAGGTHDDSNLAAICKPHHDEKTQAERTAGLRKRYARKPDDHPGVISPDG